MLCNLDGEWHPVWERKRVVARGVCDSTHHPVLGTYGFGNPDCTKFRTICRISINSAQAMVKTSCPIRIPYASNEWWFPFRNLNDNFSLYKRNVKWHYVQLIFFSYVQFIFVGVMLIIIYAYYYYLLKFLSNWGTRASCECSMLQKGRGVSIFRFFESMHY